MKTVLGNAESPQTITNVVQHLVSDDVGATCMEDLEALTLSMLPPTLGLKPIKAAKLLKYFTAPGPSSSAGGSAGTHSHAGSQGTGVEVGVYLKHINFQYFYVLEIHLQGAFCRKWRGGREGKVQGKELGSKVYSPM